QCRNLSQPCSLARTPAPLPHDQLEVRLLLCALDGSDDNRLEQPELTDRVLELSEILLVEDPSGLLAVRPDILRVDRDQPGTGNLIEGCIALRFAAEHIGCARLACRRCGLTLVRWGGSLRGRSLLPGCRRFFSVLGLFLDGFCSWDESPNAAAQASSLTHR